MEMHVNSAISYIKSRYMDIKYFYLNNHMNGAEYMMVQISMIPQEFVEKYNLKDKANTRYIFARVTNGMHGLPQSGQIAQDALFQHLEPYGYRPSIKTPVLWTYDRCKINFTLVVNGFRVKYSGKEHSLHP